MDLIWDTRNSLDHLKGETEEWVKKEILLDEIWSREEIGLGLEDRHIDFIETGEIDLFHSTSEDFKWLNVRKTRKGTDFGQAIYFTTNQKQALTWRSPKYLWHTKYLVKDLYKQDYKRFLGVTDEWAEYVKQNRRTEHNHTEWVVVSGMVADDRMFEQFSQYEKGNINLKQLANLLEAIANFNQYTIKEQGVLDNLNFKRIELR